MISGKAVSDPCPISVAADMIVIVPSAEMLIHGFITCTCPAGPAASTAALAARPATKANERPAAPTIIWRRDNSTSNALVCLFISTLPDHTFDRTDNARVSPASTDVGAHLVHDFVTRRFWILIQQIGGAHDLAGLAVPTLRNPLGDPRFLNRMAGIG